MRFRAQYGGTETILIADDDPMVRDFLRLALARCGYAIAAAANGPEAMAIASSYQAPIHLVIADIVMPGMDGRELCADLRRWFPSIGVLLMSGYVVGERTALGASDDLTFFIRKPFGLEEMAAAVRTALDWRPQHEPR
jgi:CheY-like chemotaxis protein